MAMGYGAIQSARFTADGSFGSTNGVILSAVEVSHKSTARAIAHIRIGSAAGTIVRHFDRAGAASERIGNAFTFSEPGLPITGTRGFVEVSGASTVCHAYFRNI